MLHTQIPSPSVNGFHVGPVFIHMYALAYIVGIALAVFVGRRRWVARGGDPALVEEMAVWGVPAGLIGGRIYFDITTPDAIPHVWYGVFAMWDGGMGIWGGIALATIVCVWRLRRAGVSAPLMMDALAPCILMAQGIGRIGNYFNQELFGNPTTLPWGLQIAPQYRPPGYAQYATFQPTFLYELIWDFAFAGFLMWLGRTGKLRTGCVFPLYVAGYSAFRIFEESIRIDYSQYFLGLRLNFFIATAMTAIGLAWFAFQQWGPRREGAVAVDATGAAGEVSGELANGDGDADTDLGEDGDPGVAEGESAEAAASAPRER
jgi:prolipoprotein diacylglyceryl transferase